MSLQNTINAPTDSAGWIAYTTTITASGTNPTPGTGYSSVSYYMLQGKLLHLTYTFTQSVAGSAGSGTYIFNIPSGFTADTSIVSIAVLGGGSTIGHAYINTPPSLIVNGQAILANSTQYVLAASTGFAINSTYGGLDETAVNYGVNIVLPII